LAVLDTHRNPFPKSWIRSPIPVSKVMGKKPGTVPSIQPRRVNQGYLAHRNQSDDHASSFSHSIAVFVRSPREVMLTL